MSLSQALSTATSGLRAAQAGLALVSANVANAETPGYVRKTLVQSTAGTDSIGAGVRVDGVNRELDQYVQRQLRVEAAGGAYADQRARFYDRLQLLFGQPGSDSALETQFNNFTAALQKLATTPESYPVRSNVVGAARALAQQLNSISGDLQMLRSNAESGIAGAVSSANEALQQIATINQQLAASAQGDPGTALLLDRRDYYLDRLAQLMDVRIVDIGDRQIGIFTSSGVQLVGTRASRLAFDPQGTMDASAVWSADPAKRGVGTIQVLSSNGDTVDLIAGNAIRSGEIAAFLEMRDKVLVEAQSQLDAMAASMARALSDKMTAGSAVAVGPQGGFDLDIGGVLDGNTVKLSYVDIATGGQRTVTFVRVDAPGALPLTGAAAGAPADRIVGVNFSGGTAAVAAQIGAALGPGFSASNPGGTTLRVLDDGGLSRRLTEMTATGTITSLSSGNLELPLFLDGVAPYTGAYDAKGNQLTGFASRIAVNGAVVADPARLIAFSSSPPTGAGDASRPAFIQEQMTRAIRAFPAGTGFGAPGSPYRASIPDYLRQVLAQQAQSADAARSLQQGQQVVVNALQQRFSDTAGVTIDEEMANLLKLQSAYGANARVLSTVKDMLDILMRA